MKLKNVLLLGNDKIIPRENCWDNWNGEFKVQQQVHPEHHHHHPEDAPSSRRHSSGGSPAGGPATTAATMSSPSSSSSPSSPYYAENVHRNAVVFVSLILQDFFFSASPQILTHFLS